MNAHWQLTFAAWLTTLSILGTAAFIFWLAKSALGALYRDLKRWVRRRRLMNAAIRANPIGDTRNSVRLFKQMERRR
jgi:hypothetical protein